MAGAWEIVLGGLIAAGSGGVGASITAFLDRKRYEREQLDKRRERLDSERVARLREGADMAGAIAGMLQYVEPGRMIGFSREGEAEAWLEEFEKSWVELRPRILGFGLANPSEAVRDSAKDIADSVVTYGVQVRTLAGWIREEHRVPDEVGNYATGAYNAARTAVEEFGRALHEADRDARAEIDAPP